MEVRSIAIEADVSQENEGQAMFAEMINTAGDAAILINNAKASAGAASTDDREIDGGLTCARDSQPAKDRELFDRCRG
jgi:NAD(P)-dependent dehydrogenase (short-subunit alcohol dehydrogenase family)